MQGQRGVFVSVSEVHKVCLCCALVLLLLLNKQPAKRSGKAAGTVVCFVPCLAFEFAFWSFWWFWRETGQIQKLQTIRRCRHEATHVPCTTLFLSSNCPRFARAIVANDVLSDTCDTHKHRDLDSLD
jgi:hypothetical protein